MKTHQEILIRIPEETIENLIHSIRGRKVMFDRDLANLYEVPTKVLKQAVKHNMERFPEDFMFQLTKEETQNWRSQFVTSNWAKMGIRRNPFVFTQNGVAMLSSILNSKRAVQVNIQIMRTFTKLQQILGDNKELRRKIEEMERKYDSPFKVVFNAIKELIEPSQKPKKQIGFHTSQFFPLYCQCGNIIWKHLLHIQQFFVPTLTLA
ncbi:MAG: hypothetical protein A3G87_05210 [Omnitrophica bacterium RIFCSPLOWO2_12_FULL_50_11]|nr:MAG: hypothetical protein A3G87_05210 [Omnitrophica bacterium RIFCSPLOWO2_12_FULL_50_11]